MVTEYGAEYEVCGHTVFTTERPHIMHAQAKGKITSDTPVRYEQPPNHWAFLTANPGKDESDDGAAAAAAAAAAP